MINTDLRIYSLIYNLFGAYLPHMPSIFLIDPYLPHMCRVQVLGLVDFGILMEGSFPGIGPCDVSECRHV